MEKDESYYKDLLTLYLENRCNPAQLEEVLSFLDKESSNRLLLLQLQEQFKHPSNSTSEISAEQSQNIRENLLLNINNGKVVALKTRRWKYIAAAAAIFLVTTTVYYHPGRKAGVRKKL